MSDQSRMAIMYVETENPFVVIGTKRAIGRSTAGLGTPDVWFETVDIEDHLTNLREYYQEQVDNIPEMRQLVSYIEEMKVDMIDMVFALRDSDYALTPYGLMGYFMKGFKGQCNPSVVQNFIEKELVNNGMSRIKDVDYHIKK